MNRLRMLAVTAVTAAALLASTAPALAQTNPAQRVREVGGSNMGECSAYLGGMQVRDDVNRIIRQYGDLLGIENPGEIYHVRAQQPESKPPAQECLQRSF